MGAEPTQDSLHEGTAGFVGPEEARLEVLAAHDVQGLEGDPELAAITHFASKLCDAPIALVSIVEDERQRFVAREGLSAGETPRSMSFCQHAMMRDDVMEVSDATLDPRFADNPLVTGPPHIRFYAGAPLVSEEGAPLGSLCVISPEPRDGLTEVQAEGLKVLARAVMRRLKDRRAKIEAQRALEHSETRFEALANAIPQMAWSTDADGKTDYFNARWYEYTGAKPGEHDGVGWIDALHVDDREGANAVWRRAVDEGEFYETEYRLRGKDGEYRWTLARGVPMKDDSGTIVRWFGSNTDIHAHRELSESRNLLSRELNHRIKNIFSVVAGLVSISAREFPELKPLAGKVGSRIESLSRAHDHVVREEDSDVRAASLKRLIGDLMAPYQDSADVRIRIEGEDLPVSPTSVTPIALLFHELATNAVKYGALRRPEGTVEIRMASADDQVHIDWIEQCNERIDAPTEDKGFGSELVEMSVRRQLRGDIEHRWNEQGLEVKVRVPRRAFA
ncbi:PAS domain-containing protein [Sphingomonas sp. LY29]|uniref:sensor histidine kinase n=1 Tax=Sphingomonas sp. LY29 TaxID=3095341 RepID=UPI002D793664|nr:PAS domain-containing protein [Sphingomonas sp. LY29]WRP26704.1 PAS domain-containing protein [Sphingomonas sp. LY29]